jgi:hypothetical protein
MPVRDLLSAASGASVPATYIEDVFSTWLYTGTGAAQTINNGLNLSAYGGMVWLKPRSANNYHTLWDTARGVRNYIMSQATDANATASAGYGLTAFNSNGFSLGSNWAGENQSGTTEVSWTFRKQPKFFDVVTYTATGSVQTINHSLGSTPGMIIVKAVTTAGNWAVYHSGLNGGTTPQNYTILLNSTGAQFANSGYWNNTAPTSTQFTIGTNANVNAAGETYVAYIYASNAGGFGLAGTDNVVTCGNFTTDGNGAATVNLGYEPQYLMVKQADGTDSWYITDVMRGFSNTEYNYLRSNSASAETVNNVNPSYVFPTATGFSTGTNGQFNPSVNYIYMAIRRPMKVPTDATTVFKPDYNASFPQPGTVTTNFVADWDIYKRTGGSSTIGGTRLTGGNYLFLNATDAESAGSSFLWDSNTSLVVKDLAGSGNPTINWAFSRRPGFFDVVCYTGTGSATTQAHNLGVVPELIITKERNTTGGWATYSSGTGANKYFDLNDGQEAYTNVNVWNNTSPTSSVFSLGISGAANGSGNTYVAYLFATCPGVSKVGSYTGTGTPQVIDCGFTGGARFVLIKRTDAAANWFVWDTARGMVAGTDPSLSLNTTSAEVNANSVYTATTGFSLLAVPSADVNTLNGNYIFLAIA